MKKTNLKSIYCRVVLLVLCGTLAWATGKKLTGSIWTTNSTGTRVNENKYTDKTLVYLNGGPQVSSPDGLPAGKYYFQVTSVPAAGNNEQLLSADDPSCRQVQVGSNNRIDGPVGIPGAACGDGSTQVPGLAAGTFFSMGSVHSPGTTDPSNGSTSVQVCPAATRTSDNLGNGALYDATNWCDTTNNNGGGYKVWITPVKNYPAQGTNKFLLDGKTPDPTYCSSNITFGFCDDFSKIDYFKVKTKECNDPSCGGTQTDIIWPLGGYKFYDANANGIWDAGEPVIDGWQVRAVKSCQEDQSVLSAYLGPFLGASVTLNVYDTNLITPPPLPYGRQFQYTAAGTTYETDAFQNPGSPTNTFAADGFYQYTFLNAGGHYSVCEIIPLGNGMFFPTGLSTLSGTPRWRATTSTESDDHFLPTDSANFGNLCLGGGKGLTLGFWSNTNGESVMAYGPSFANKVAKSCDKTADNSPGMIATLTWLSQQTDPDTGVTGLYLVDAKGNYINPSTMGYCAFRTWLLNATSTNSAYMLSAQLATMELNVHFKYVDPNALIYAPGTNSANTAGYATVNDVIGEAIDSLTKNPYVTALLNNGVTLKAYQVAVKNALDNANNNLGFVQAGPGSCPVPAYADAASNSCIPSDAQDIGATSGQTTNTFQPIPQNPAPITVNGTTYYNSPACAVNELTNIVGASNCTTTGGKWTPGTPSGSCDCSTAGAAWTLNTTNGTCQAPQ